MKKYIGYLPAVLLLVFYLLTGLTGVSMVLPIILIWLACLLMAGVLLHKGIVWGGVFGAFPALFMALKGGTECFRFQIGTQWLCADHRGTPSSFSFCR